MSCYGCGSSFGAFKKEHGCKNCGFAFCMNCLPNKLPIAKLNNEKHRVCVKCYNILTGKVKLKEEDPARYSPPENYKKRVAALEEKESKGHSVGSSEHRGPSGGGHLKSGHKAMSQADRDIEQRLEKLREKTPQEIAASKVSNHEIDHRLAALKGMDPARYNTTSKPVYHPPDRRTQQEQMNDLLDEIASEVELDSRLPDPAQEVAARLERLKAPLKSQTADQEDENNLNKASMRDSQTFSHNISTNSEPSKVSSYTKTPADKQSKASEVGHSGSVDEVSPEELGRIVSDAARELEEDAQKALQGLQEDKEIMKKLQEIKQRRKESSTDVNKNEEMTSDSENEEEDDDEKMEQSIIRQAIEENKLDEAAARDGINTSKTSNANNNKPSNVDINKTSNINTDKTTKSKQSVKAAKKIINTDEEWYDPDELPYCCICTEDATVRCLGCDRDLYCNSCFKEGHKELGLDDHVTVKYTPPTPETT